jgi:pimeloyl-ACP methyl ester carboxylesterase
MKRRTEIALLTVILLLVVPTTAAAQTDSVAHHIAHLAAIDESLFSTYEDEYTYDEEFFADGDPATIYYPKEMTGKVPAVILIHGFNSNKTRMKKIPEQLSSHGFIVLTYTATDQSRPFEWPPALIAAYQILVGEDRRAESPLYGHIDFDAIALVGHSMGGTGVLHAAMTPFPNGLKDKVKTVIALNPYNGGPLVAEVGGGANDALGADLSRLTVPTLIVTGSYDALAYPWLSYDFCRNFRGPGKLAFVSIHRLNHTDWYALRNEPRYEIMRAIIYTWLMAYLRDDMPYRDYYIDRPGSAFDRYIRPYLSNSTSRILINSEEFPAYILSD